MTGAAFFDLDRTLLSGGTGPHLSQAMYDLGVVNRKLPGEKYIYGMFDLIGETLPSMFLARQATRVAKGRPANAFGPAAAQAAEKIADVVHPFAKQLIDQHKAAGRPVVMATTTPLHLIEPLAHKLGFDDVIATNYAVDDDGNFDGAIDGPFVWSLGKLGAVKAWAQQHDVDLEDSYAYSDSIYDTPLLSAVGHPNAVNPDAQLVAYAIAKRWPIVHFDVNPGVVKLPILGWELQDVAKQFFRPELIRYAKFDVDGVDNIPKTGPVILVGNHRSYFDVAAVAQIIRQSGRPLRMLGKKEVFDVPVVGGLGAALGGIRVDRESDGRSSYEEATRALAAGEMVGLLPQGTIPRGPAFFDPVLKGKTGAARLAAESGAPVIPFGLWGTEKVWPRSATLPNMTTLLNPPTIRVRVGPPVDLKLRSASADTKRIMAAISDLLPPEGRELHEPTEAELRSTYPGGRLPGESKD